MRMNKSKENTLTYIHRYICTHSWSHKNIYIYRYTHAVFTCTHYLLFKSDGAFPYYLWKYFNRFFLTESGKLFHIEGPI